MNVDQTVSYPMTWQETHSVSLGVGIHLLTGLPLSEKWPRVGRWLRALDVRPALSYRRDKSRTLTGGRTVTLTEGVAFEQLHEFRGGLKFYARYLVEPESSFVDRVSNFAASMWPTARPSIEDQLGPVVPPRAETDTDGTGETEIVETSGATTFVVPAALTQRRDSVGGQEPAENVDQRGRREPYPNWRPRDMELFLLKSILLIDTAALAATFVDAFRQAAPHAQAPDGLTDMFAGWAG